MTINEKHKVLLILVIFYVAGLKFFLPDLWVYIFDYIQRIVIIVLLLPDAVSALRQKVKHNFLSWFAFIGTTCWGLFVISIFFPHEWHFEIDTYFHNFPDFPDISDHWLYPFDLTIGILLAAISEELFFRYKLNQFFEKRNMGVWSRAFLTSLLFAGMHYRYGVLGLTDMFLFGAIYFFMFYKSGSIRFSIMAHYFYNLIIFGSLSLG